jgi:hypothetical protein
MARAKHYCAGGCRTLIPAGQRRCAGCDTERRRREAAQGGAWGSGRTGTAEHKAFAEAVLARDRFCMLKYEGCQYLATVAGHIVPVAAGGITVLRNGRGECGACSRDRAAGSGRTYSTGLVSGPGRMTPH